MTYLPLRSCTLCIGFLVSLFHAGLIGLFSSSLEGKYTNSQSYSASLLSAEIIDLSASTAFEGMSKQAYKNKDAFVAIDGGKLDSSALIANQAGSITTGISKPTFLPTIESLSLNNPKPAYPISSRERGEEGKVLLHVCADANGKIADLDVIQSSGYPALDRSSLETVRRWKFAPAIVNGSSLSQCYRVPINFELKN